MKIRKKWWNGNAKRNEKPSLGSLEKRRRGKREEEEMMDISQVQLSK